MEDSQKLNAPVWDVENARAQRKIALALAETSRQQIADQRSGVFLPDSTKIVVQLRENRMDELSDFR